MTSLNDFLKRHSNEVLENQDAEYLSEKESLESGIASLYPMGMISLGILNISFYKYLDNRSFHIINIKLGDILLSLYPFIFVSIYNEFYERVNKLSEYQLSEDLTQDRDFFQENSLIFINRLSFMKEYCCNEIHQYLKLDVNDTTVEDFRRAMGKYFADYGSDFRAKYGTDIIPHIYLRDNYDISIDNDSYEPDFYQELYSDLQANTQGLLIVFGILYLINKKIISLEYWPRSMVATDTYRSLLCNYEEYYDDKIFKMSLDSRKEIISVLMNDISAIFSYTFNESISLSYSDVFADIRRSNEFHQIWNNELLDKIKSSGEYTILPSYNTNYSEYMELCEKRQRIIQSKSSNSATTSKSSSAIQNFLSSNSAMIVSKLKESGLQLSSAALQNDENIARIAGVIHNLLPTAIRFFVSYHSVEKFLLENRYWLIEKLR